MGMRSQRQNAGLRQSVPGTLGCNHFHRLWHGETRWDECVGKAFDRAECASTDIRKVVQEFSVIKEIIEI